MMIRNATAGDIPALIELGTRMYRNPAIPKTHPLTLTNARNWLRA